MSTGTQDARPARPARRGRGRPKGQDSAVVREAALSAAIALIAEHGYAATSMSQVAETAGISPSGLAHHFSSKTALLAAVLDHRDARDPIAGYEEGDDPWHALDSLVAMAGKNMGQRQLVALYMTMVGEAVHPDHPAHDWMVRHYDLAWGVVEQGILTGQRHGLVRQDAPARRIARALVAMMDGLQVQWLLDPSIDMRDEMEAYVDGLKQRWGAPPA